MTGFHFTHSFQASSCGNPYQDFISFCCQIVSHCVYIYYVLFIDWWAFVFVFVFLLWVVVDNAAVNVCVQVLIHLLTLATSWLYTLKWKWVKFSNFRYSGDISETRHFHSLSMDQCGSSKHMFHIVLLEQVVPLTVMWLRNAQCQVQELCTPFPSLGKLFFIRISCKDFAPCKARLFFHKDLLVCLNFPLNFLIGICPPPWALDGGQGLHSPCRRFLPSPNPKHARLERWIRKICCLF